MRARGGGFALVPAKVTTSARRWDAIGMAKTTAVNHLIVAAYACGVPVDVLHRWYRGAGRGMGGEGGTRERRETGGKNGG